MCQDDPPARHPRSTEETRSVKGGPSWDCLGAIGPRRSVGSGAGGRPPRHRVYPSRHLDPAAEPQEPGEPPLALAGIPHLPSPIPRPPRPCRVHLRCPLRAGRRPTGGPAIIPAFHSHKVDRSSGENPRNLVPIFSKLGPPSPDRLGGKGDSCRAIARATGRTKSAGGRQCGRECPWLATAPRPGWRGWCTTRRCPAPCGRRVCRTWRQPCPDGAR